MVDKNIIINLTIKENVSKEEIKKIIEDILEEKVNYLMRRGFDFIPDLINN